MSNAFKCIRNVSTQICVYLCVCVCVCLCVPGLFMNSCFQFISLSPEKSLAKMNMSKDETHQMMENLAHFQAQFSDVLKGFTSLMENIEFTSFNDSLAIQAKCEYHSCVCVCVCVLGYI